MSDACGCGDDEPRSDDDERGARAERLWQISELQFAALSGVFLLAGLIAGSRRRRRAGRPALERWRWCSAPTPSCPPR